MLLADGVLLSYSALPCQKTLCQMLQEEQQKLSMRIVENEHTFYPLIQYTRFCATGVSSGLTTRATLTRVLRRLGQSVTWQWTCFWLHMWDVVCVTAVGLRFKFPPCRNKGQWNNIQLINKTCSVLDPSLIKQPFRPTEMYTPSTDNLQLQKQTNATKRNILQMPEQRDTRHRHRRFSPKWMYHVGLLRTYCHEDEGGVSLCNVGIYVQVHKALQLRRLASDMKRYCIN